jgi:hypothetical protein
MDDWAKKRLAELEAAAPVKRKNKKDAFVKVPLWWIEAAAKATRTPQAFVCVWLHHLAWKADVRPSRCLTIGWPRAASIGA